MRQVTKTYLANCSTGSTGEFIIGIVAHSWENTLEQTGTTYKCTYTFKNNDNGIKGCLILSHSGLLSEESFLNKLQESMSVEAYRDPSTNWSELIISYLCQTGNESTELVSCRSSVHHTNVCGGTPMAYEYVDEYY